MRNRLIADNAWIMYSDTNIANYMDPVETHVGLWEFCVSSHKLPLWKREHFELLSLYPSEVYAKNNAHTKEVIRLFYVQTLSVNIAIHMEKHLNGYLIPRIDALPDSSLTTLPKGNFRTREDVMQTDFFVACEILNDLAKVSKEVFYGLMRTLPLCLATIIFDLCQGDVLFYPELKGGCIYEDRNNGQ